MTIAMYIGAVAMPSSTTRPRSSVCDPGLHIVLVRVALGPSSSS